MGHFWGRSGRQKSPVQNQPNQMGSLERSKTGFPWESAGNTEERNEAGERPGALCARPITSTRSAGGFRESELTLFPRSKGDLDADIGKKTRIPRFDRVEGDAVLRKEKFREMKEEKNRHTVWLTDNAWELVEERYQKDNCSTKNEYIEKAIRFYSGYLDSERAEEYLPRVLAQVLEGKLDAFGKRIGRQMFKQAVDENLMANLVAFYFETDEDLVQKLRVKCVKNVKETNGEIDFLDALRYQKGARE